MKLNKHLCIIPARLNSSRFPNKPLAPICGIPMLGHVALNATKESIFDEVFVATCDNEIVEYCNSINIKSILTSHNHERATDRTQEATEFIENKLNVAFDFITMLQGDEPMITSNILKKITNYLNLHQSTKILNLISKVEDEDEFLSKNSVKIVCNLKNEIMLFSRCPIPNYTFNKSKSYKQLGIITFQRQFLDTYSKLSPTYLEQIESVDMLRCLEHGFTINTLEITEKLYPVDIKEDITKVEKYISNPLT